MSFDGVIEEFSGGRISGWVRRRIGDVTVPVSLQLRFRALGRHAPTHLFPLSDDRTGFRFLLPPEFGRMAWTEFLDQYESVTAWATDNPAETWRVPFYKSVLRALDADNRTAILADRRREYSLAPKPDGRIAVFTIVYNEQLMLPLWAKYYAALFGGAHVYVLDQGSTTAYPALPDGVTLIRLPRDDFDNWLIARLVASFQRHLLESYDAVLYCDSDEFVCAAPEALRGETLPRFLLGLPDPVGITRGYNLHHDLSREAAYDPSRPLLDQRRFIMRETTMDKPLISRVPLNWIPGFHSAREGGVAVPGLFMLHLRWFDLDAALVKGGHYRASPWNPYDLDRSLAAYQRMEESEIAARFRNWTNMFAATPADGFAFDRPVTVAPDWMRAAIPV